MIAFFFLFSSPQRVQGGAVVHHVIVERMTRRKYRVTWRKIAGANQTMKMSGNMKKTWLREKTEFQNT